ncbi:MAG: 2Fe-2S iron-sulfur cluster-binding protein, partial [Blastocatellia bacterium]
MSTDTTSQTCTITVDGVPVVVPAGALLIEALKMQGIDIPNFCYYQNLPAQASCRMCLVRIEKMPRLQPSCTTIVKDGMAVEVNTPEITDMRRGMLEFMLADHPLDCPVCDRGGECELQDNVFKFGHVDARFTEDKHPIPDVDISPFIYNDAQRCVFCYRCVRVCDVWMDVGALAKLNRGSHETIGTFDGWLDCEHCGNCVDVCPTGTLMHTSYKYGPRPWNLDETETTCSYCADGCRVRLGSRGNVVHRSVARQGTGINEEYLCVKGRYGFDYINSGERVTQPLIRKHGELRPATWDDALEHVAKRLGDIAKAKGADAVAVLGSTRITNEANVAIAIVADALDTTQLSYKPDFDLATFMKSVAGRLATKADIASADTIFVIGGDPKEDQPLTAHQLLQPVLKGRSALYVASSRLARIRKRASQFVHLRPGGEAALLLGLAGGSSDVSAKSAGCAPSDVEALRKALESSRR